MSRLLEVRRHEESVARQAYAIALQREQEAAEVVAAERAALDRAHEALREAQRGRLSVETWRELLARTFDHEQLLEVRARVLAQRAAERRRAEGTWRTARQRERSIERLEERRAAEAAQEARRREQKALDEVGLRRFAAADRGSDGSEGDVR